MPVASVIVTETFDVIGPAVGVPVITPVLELRVRPNVERPVADHV